MIKYEDALSLISKAGLDSVFREVPLAEATGAVLAEDLTARIPSPPYTNSAMDGFAVRISDLGQQPLRVAGTILARPAGPEGLPAYQTGQCVRIMTGGMVPDWADAVIPVEQSSEKDGMVRFATAPETGANIRMVGEDLEQGTILLKAGTRMDAERIMVAAAFGYGTVKIEIPVRLHLISTGDELCEPGTDLPPGAVYNSSKYFLLAAASAAGIRDVRHQTIPDDAGLAGRVIEEISGSGDPVVILSTGAVSAGDLDFIPQLGASLGFEACFHKVAIRPGKPVYFAKRGNVLWMGLPGNPVSTCVGWHFFARPLLQAVMNLPAPEKRVVTLMNEVRKPEGLRCFFRAEINNGKAWVSRRQGSAHLAASLGCHGYVELPEDLTRIPADTRVTATII